MKKIVLLLVLAVSVLSSCTRDATAKSGQEPWPKTFRYNVAIGVEDLSAREKRVDLIKGYLERQLGMPVEITTTVGYGPVIEAMRAKKIDASAMGPFAYLIASEKAGAEAIVTRGSAKDGNPGDYAGTIAVPADSPYQSIDELVKHAKDVTISFVDPASASGFLVQRAYLDSRGVNPETDFKKIVFSNNHIASAMTLLAHKVDAAAISENTFNTLVKKGNVKPEEVRTLWKSPPIPNSPIAVRKDLPAELKRKLQDVLVEMPVKAPEVYSGMLTTVAPPDTTYVRINDATFDGLRNMARGVKTTKLLEH